MQRHAILHGQFHRTWMQDYSPQMGQFQHLVVGYFSKFAGIRHDTGISGIDTVHVGINFAQVGL